MSDDEILERIHHYLSQSGVAFDTDLAALRKLEDRRAKWWWRNHVPVEDTRGVRVLAASAAVPEIGTEESRIRTSAAFRLVRKNIPHCAGVLELILQNGSNREKSIWQLMKKLQKNGNARR